MAVGPPELSGWYEMPGNFRSLIAIAEHNECSRPVPAVQPVFALSLETCVGALPMATMVAACLLFCSASDGHSSMTASSVTGLNGLRRHLAALRSLQETAFPSDLAAVLPCESVHYRISAANGAICLPSTVYTAVP
jgi:hypothetical protein